MSNVTEGAQALPTGLRTALDAIKRRGRFATAKQIAGDLNITPQAAYMRFLRLKRRGLIRSSGVEAIEP